MYKSVFQYFKEHFFHISFIPIHYTGCCYLVLLNHLFIKGNINILIQNDIKLYIKISSVCIYLFQ